MANTLKNLLHTQLSTDSASLYTCPGGTKTIVIGMSAANVLSNNNVNFSAGLQDSSGAAAKVTHIVKNATIPAGSSLEVMAGNKLVVQNSGSAGDVIRVSAGTASACDATISVLEDV